MEIQRSETTGQPDRDPDDLERAGDGSTYFDLNRTLRKHRNNQNLGDPQTVRMPEVAEIVLDYLIDEVGDLDLKLTKF